MPPTRCRVRHPHRAMLPVLVAMRTCADVEAELFEALEPLDLANANETLFFVPAWLLRDIGY